MATTQHMPVSALQAESECIICSLGHDEKTAQRLVQMGILPGTHLRIIRVAPLGGTIEVTGGQGQSFALRQEEVAAMTCDPVAMPLASELVIVGHTYRIRVLSGGKTFRQRMEREGFRKGGLIQVRETGVKPIPVYLVDMDRLMHRLGLDGKAFISILLGYGCNVPAVMGTRILTSSYSRMLTMLLIPFTLCTARLQIFVFLTAMFFSPAVAPWIIVSLYLCSFTAVILIGLVLKLFRIGGSPEPFIMEIPPYRLPTLRSISLRTWYELKDFLSRAATLIVAGVLIVWLLIHMPADVPPASAATWAGQLGQLLAPVFQPLGIDWQETVALIFGFIAKEIVIGGLAVIYGGSDLIGQMSSHITPLQSISFMLFCLLYTPCVATIAAIWAESRSISITLLSLVSGLVIAWITSFVFYQSGLLLGF